MSKLNKDLECGKMSFPQSIFSIYRGRPNDELFEEMDYVVKSNGKMQGCGPYPSTPVAGVSTFGWGATDSESAWDCPCTIVLRFPDQILLVSALLLQTGEKDCQWPPYRAFPE